MNGSRILVGFLELAGRTGSDRQGRLSCCLGLAAGLALSATAMADPGPAPEPIAITGGRVVTMTGRTYDPGRVLIVGGKIEAVGGNDIDVPARAKVVDATGAWVVPGLIDAGTGLGLVEVSLEESTTDFDESSSLFMPHLRVTDAINPQSEVINVNRLTGVTTVLVRPSEDNFFAGQAAIVDLAGASIEEMTVRAPAMLCLNLGNQAIARGRANKRFSTRMGLVADIREQFVKAQEHIKKQERHARKVKEHEAELARWEAKHGKGAPPAKPTTGAAASDTTTPAKPEQPEEPARDLKLEALAQALERKLPVLVRAHREDDIRAAVRLADEFKLKLIINHATEAWRVAELLAKKDIPAIVGPINQQPDSFETLGARYDNAELLRRAGVKIAIQSDEIHNVRNLPYAAGLAAAHGLPPEEALEAITIGAARVLGIADRYGSIEKGKVANIAVVEGDPLQPASKLRKLFIRGKDVPLTSRQTELLQKFKR